MRDHFFARRRTVSVVLAIATAVALAPSARADQVRSDHGGKTTLVSIGWDGQPTNNTTEVGPITDDGRYVVFASEADNLVEDQPISFDDHIFIHDRSTGMTELLVKTLGGDWPSDSSTQVAMTGDGRFVAFTSASDELVAGDTNGSWDIFVLDRQTGITEKVSQGRRGGPAARHAFGPKISEDGRYVTYWSRSRNIVAHDRNKTEDIFRFDRTTHRATLVSRTPEGAVGNDQSTISNISGDGRFVAFSSQASDLAPRDTNGETDIFLFDAKKQRVTMTSRAHTGESADASSDAPELSRDGSTLFFRSSAENLLPESPPFTWSIYQRDRRTGELTIVSRRPDGSFFKSSTPVSLSPDGDLLVFESADSSLSPGDDNQGPDVFVMDLGTSAITLVSAALDGSAAEDYSNAGWISATGAVTFSSRAGDLVEDDPNERIDLFVRTLG